LCQSLVSDGYDVIALSRNKIRGKEILGEKVTVVEWDSRSAKGWESYANSAQAIINLAGENLSSGRWTRKKKQSILKSRLSAGRAVVEAVKLAKKKPKVVIQASAMGYYGPRLDEIIDESSSAGEGFLVDVAKQWEHSTKEIESMTRRVIVRTGVVLGRDGGALPRLAQPFRFFLGGPLGTGRQWFSWIHLEDEVRAIRFLMEKESAQGPFNLTAPEQLKMRDFCRILGKIMKRPCWIMVPGFALRILLGEMAKEMLLSGQRVVPKRLKEEGYKFVYPEARLALEELLGENKGV
jgi:uncharacterized protein (TIGR01777 family)